MSSATVDQGNLAALVLRHADRVANRPAVIAPRPGGGGDPGAVDIITFGDLARKVAGYQAGLRKNGLRAGDRVLMLLPVSVDFYALALALLGSGLAVVLIDGRMGFRRVVRALGVARPRAIVTVRAVARFWPVVPAMWGARRFVADAGGLDLLFSPAIEPATVEPCPIDTPALLSFTSGSSGRPKGAVRTHDILTAQHLALQGEFPERDDEVDMPCFPALTLHNLCCGITTVLPPVDLRAPASVIPEHVLRFAQAFGVTSLSGAPAYMTRLVEHMETTGVRAPEVRRLGVGGAPVSRRLCGRITRVFDRAECRVVYGSTEAEPIASLPMQEASAAGVQGFPAGHIAPATRTELVRLPEGTPELDARGLSPYRVAPGAVGEVVVRGAHVNRAYHRDPAAIRENKLGDPDGGVWHRTGDLARADGAGRLWLEGRRGDAVHAGDRELEPYPVEADLLDLEGVAAAAVVDVRGRAEVALALEQGAAEDQLAARARAVLEGQGLGAAPLHWLESLPVDARHQSKVDRPTLRRALGKRRVA